MAILKLEWITQDGSHRTGIQIINGCKYIGLGIAAVWGYFAFSDEFDDCDDGCEDEDEEERCAKVKEACIEGCSTFVLGKPRKHRPWTNGWSGHDFNKCVALCMEREGCR